MTLKCTLVDDCNYGSWHVIYQTGDLDYCRENLPESVTTVAEAKRRATTLFEVLYEDTQQQLVQESHGAPVDSYRLERW